MANSYGIGYTFKIWIFFTTGKSKHFGLIDSNNDYPDHSSFFESVELYELLKDMFCWVK